VFSCHSVIQVGARHPATHPPPGAPPTPALTARHGGANLAEGTHGALRKMRRQGAATPGPTHRVSVGCAPSLRLPGQPRTAPLRRLPLLSARWTAAGACLTRGAPAASKRTPQRACEGVEELDSSHAHLRRFLVKATDDFSAVGTESRLSCSPDFVHSLRRHRIACRSMCEREAGCGPSGAGAAQLAPRPNNSWLPCPRLHPSLRSLFILSFSSPLFPLPLPPKPHFSVATPSFLSSLI
jgi:hypothetical protein